MSNKMRVENQPVICSVKIYLGKMNQQEVDHLVEVQVKTFHTSWLVIDFVEKWEWNETYPPENSRLDHLKNHPIAKENHLPSTSFFGDHVNIPGLSRWFKQALLYVPYFEGL